jgi:hypothetical protein
LKTPVVGWYLNLFKYMMKIKRELVS